MGIHFPPNYLRVSEPWLVVNLLQPMSAFHPNARWPFLCCGTMKPGTGLVDILYQSFEILSGKKYSTRDPLHDDASAWARRHPERFPVDDRPLKWRRKGANV